jgi:hypothetical protein
MRDAVSISSRRNRNWSASNRSAGVLGGAFVMSIRTATPFNSKSSTGLPGPRLLTRITVRRNVFEGGVRRASTPCSARCLRRSAGGRASNRAVERTLT